MIPTILIKSKDFHDAWYQMNREIMKDGFEIPSDQTEAKLTKDVCATIELTGEAINQIMRHELHPDYPMKSGLESYVKQFDYDTDEFKSSESTQEYTYSGRMFPEHDMIKTYGKTMYDRGIQFVTWNKYRDFGNEVRPCLQRMWFRQLNNTDVELHLTFRSHDVFAWQFNMIALVDYAMRYVTNGFNIVKIVEFNDSLHVYDYDWDDSLRVRKPTMNMRKCYE